MQSEVQPYSNHAVDDINYLKDISQITNNTISAESKDFAKSVEATILSLVSQEQELELAA